MRVEQRTVSGSGWHVGKPFVAIAVLALTFLGACGGGEGAGEERVLTAQEYAEAMADAYATLQDDGVQLAEDLERAFEQAFAALEEGPTEDSWSDEHTEVATEFAETLLQAQARFLEGLLGVLEDYGDEISSLRPPAQLADLHNTMTASIEEILREGREVAEDLKDIDTDIDSEAELEDFWTALQSIGDSYSVSWAQLEAACRGLRARLELVLGASVAICEAGETREPGATPQPAAATPERPAGQGDSVETDREALAALYNATGARTRT